MFFYGPSWSYGIWIYNYLCNQCLSPITLYVQMPFRRGVLDTTVYDKVCQWLAAGQWFSPGTPVSSTNKTDRHDIDEILLKLALNTKSLTPNPIYIFMIFLCFVSCFVIVCFRLVFCLFVFSFCWGEGYCLFCLFVILNYRGLHFYFK